MALSFFSVWGANMNDAKRVRAGVSPSFKYGFKTLPSEVQNLIYDFATLDFRMAANRIRTAYRLFKRRVRSDVEWFVYTPSEQSQDNLPARLVRGFRVY
jgi:hypothetical protein